MPKNWQDISVDEILNFDGAQTGQMSQYDRIMQHHNNVALSDVRAGLHDVKKSVHMLAEKIEERSASLELLLNKSGEAQKKSQNITIALSVVIAFATVIYTAITWQTVLAQREANAIQRQLIAQNKNTASEKTP